MFTVLYFKTDLTQLTELNPSNQKTVFQWVELIQDNANSVQNHMLSEVMTTLSESSINYEVTSCLRIIVQTDETILLKFHILFPLRKGSFFIIESAPGLRCSRGLFLRRSCTCAA